MLSDTPEHASAQTGASVDSGMPSPTYLIIGGAEKSGTTSLFGYLAAHTSVAASSRKETDFFRQTATPLEDYERHFERDRTLPVRMESSPAYLAEAEAVAPRIAATLPDARLVFVLREPVERLRSAFRFYKSRLHLPADMNFDDFVGRCLDYERQGLEGNHQGLKRWHLMATQRGRYERLLPAFEQRFDPARILLVRSDRLRSDVCGVVGDISRFVGLQAGFYDGYSFERENVSFVARNRGAQRVAIAVNNSLEPLWRRHPDLKRTLLKWYKQINERPLDRDELSPKISAALDDYYAATRERLAVLP